jgi:hypothetical protein
VTLLAILVLLAIALGARESRRTRFWMIAIAMVCAAFYLVWLQEHLLGRVDYFISDERYYVDQALAPTFSWQSLASHGFLWIAINRWMTSVDFGLGVHGLKVLNVPILLCFVVITHRIFSRDHRVLAIPFILPYTMWLALFNMRDLGILLAAAAAIYGLLAPPRIRLAFAVPGSLGLILLRPEFFVVLVLACGVAALRNVRQARPAQIVRVAMIVLLIAATTGPALLDRINRAIVWAEYSKVISYDTFADTRLAQYRTSSILLDGGVSLVRYVLTPFPHSLAGRLVRGGSHEWGLVDDVVRLGSQIGYYACLVILLARLGRLRAVFRGLTSSQLAMLIFLLAYAPIYGIHLFGVSHQRLKIPFQIAVALLAIGVSRRVARNDDGGLPETEGVPELAVAGTGTRSTSP